ncbi:hypothetical protein [Fodinicurvata sediminis]|uniref:hypothetical protein n=1 Tax=Fodinicurvata sediminis TaxID=1121832 RepID=UPI0003B6F8B1|nr:hypothetical protein [Fodinicurvata sediminis]
MTLPAVIPEETCPTVRQHAGDLSAWGERMKEGRKPRAGDRLLPLGELRRAVAELEGAMQPADKAAVGKWTRALIGGYRVTDSAFRDEKHAETFIHSLSFDLAEFPEDIITRTVHEIRRICKWLPSCAEVYQHAKALMAERQGMLQAARAQIAEHERRQGERQRQQDRLKPENLSPDQQAKVERMFQQMKGGMTTGDGTESYASVENFEAQDGKSGASGGVTPGRAPSVTQRPILRLIQKTTLTLNGKTTFRENR